MDDPRSLATQCVNEDHKHSENRHSDGNLAVLAVGMVGIINGHSQRVIVGFCRRFERNPVLPQVLFGLLVIPLEPFRLHVTEATSVLLIRAIAAKRP